MTIIYIYYYHSESDYIRSGLQRTRAVVEAVLVHAYLLDLLRLMLAGYSLIGAGQDPGRAFFEFATSRRAVETPIGMNERQSLWYDSLFLVNGSKPYSN